MTSGNLQNLRIDCKVLIPAKWTTILKDRNMMSEAFPIFRMEKAFFHAIEKMNKSGGGRLF